MIGITIDTIFDKRPDLAAATKKQVDSARVRALTKLRKRIETMVKQKVAKVERIPQKGLDNRVFSSKVQRGDDVMKVWIGTWDVEPFAIGTPTQNLRGVKAGRHSWPGAFLARIYTNQTKVWVRLHSPHYSPELYPTKKRPGDRGWSELRGRFPVVRAAIPIDDTVRDVMSANEGYLLNEFEKLLVQELNFEVNVRGAA